MYTYNNADKYFYEALIFLEKFKWLYDVPLTRILIEQSLDKIPFIWLRILRKMHYSQLNDFVTKMDMQCNWPTSLVEFLNTCQKLCILPNRTIPLVPIKLPTEFKKNMSLKKQHEILYFSRLIHEKCLSQNVSVIVDLGTGLGYISQLLNCLYGYKIIGIDSSSHNIERAKLRQKNSFPDSISTMKYVCASINNESNKLIESVLRKEFPEDKKICLMGLHACGDLSACASDLFLKLDIAELLVLVSCCYHKLSVVEFNENCKDDSRTEYFQCFPLSNVFKKNICASNINIKTLCKRPFMRLASQESSDRWIAIDKECHYKHSLYVLSRAVLELFAHNNDLTLKKLVRKGTRKSQCLNFEDYLKDSMFRYKYEKIIDAESSIIGIPWTDEVEKNILSLWESNIEKLKIVEPFTALQTILQNVMESLILNDRIHLLKEESCDADLFPVANRLLSPRCFALVSNKIY